MRYFANWLTSHRLLCGLLLAIITAVAACGYLPRVDPQVASRQKRELDSPSEQVASQFDLGRSEAFLVVESEDLFRPDTVAAVRAMVERVEGLPVVDSVFSLDEIPNLNVFGIAEPLLPPNDASAASFREAQSQLLAHPLVRGQLLSPDGKTLMLPVVYDWLQMRENEDCTTLVLATARAAIAESLSGHPDAPAIRVRLTGNVPLFLAHDTAFRRYQILFRLLGYGLAVVLSVLMFRGVAAVFLVASAPALGIFWCFGLLELMGLEINDLSNVILPVLVSMIGLTDGVHLVSHIRNQRAAGASQIAAARSAIEHVGWACWLTSLTTAIGFVSLLLARTEAVRDFGLVCALGVLITFVAIVVYLPWASTLPLARGIARGQQRDLIGHGMGRLAAVVQPIVNHRWSISIAAALVTIVFGSMAFNLRPDSRLADTMPSGSEPYAALRHCDEAFGGISLIRVVAHWPTDEIDDDAPHILAAIRDVEALANEEPLLSHPLSINNMLATFPGDPMELETQMTFLSLLPRSLKSFFFRAEENEAVVVMRVQDRGIAQYVPVFERLDNNLRRLEQRYSGFEFRSEGDPIRRSRRLFDIINDLAISLGTASVVILIVLVVAYRSLRLGLICIVPNLFPLAATGALLMVTGSSLDMSSVCAFTVSLGIAVDDTIHFLSRYQRELSADHDVREAIRRTFVGVGVPMIMTTVILVSGFGTLFISDLGVHRTFGAMACTTIGTALVADLIALPALLACFAASDQRRRH